MKLSAQVVEVGGGHFSSASSLMSSVHSATADTFADFIDDPANAPEEKDDGQSK